MTKRAVYTLNLANLTCSTITTNNANIMPAKRQRPLLFQRTIIQHATCSTATASDNTPALDSENGTPAPPDSSATTSAILTPTPTSGPRSPASSLPSRKKPLRNSWIFRHMPDEDMQTLYYSEITGLEEWRCAYCDRKYLCSGGTSIASRHLIEDHEIPLQSIRGAKVQNIQKSMEAAFAQVAANP
jgi:hypothetical protein